MSTALVTGDKGFIGTHLCEALLREGWDVEGFDLKDGWDIRQREPFPEADWCFHLAAITDARSTDTTAIMNTNVIGTFRLLKQFKDKLVFASSSAVNYPVTPYAISKLTAEQLCTSYGARIVRLCNIHGRGGHGVFEKFREQDVLEIAGIGDQLRTYAPVEDAITALMNAPLDRPGCTCILSGENLTVNEVAAKYFPDKPRQRVNRQPTDIIDGRQLCP